MSCVNNNSDINQTFIIEALSSSISACTGVYTNLLGSCSGDTSVLLETGVVIINGSIYTNQDLTANTINANFYYSGGTDLQTIINYTDISGGTFNNLLGELTLTTYNNTEILVTGFTDYYTTGATLIDSTVYFNRNDALSAYTLDLSTLDVNDTFITGVTFNNNNLVLTNNSGGTITTLIDNFSGLTVNGDLTVTGTTNLNDLISSGNTILNNLSANTISSSTITTSGLTVSGDTILNNLSASTIFSTDIITSGLTVNGILSASTISTTGLTVDGTISATTISATTYLNLPIDVRVTGGTFNNVTDTITFINNTGGTFSVTGLTDIFITGGSFNNNTDSIIFTNNTGGTFTVSGLTDIYITGGSLNESTKILTYVRNDNVNINVGLPFRLFNDSTANTVSNVFITIDTITGITDNSNSFISSYVSAYKDSIDYGFWKRTLALNKVSGILKIVGENSDFDRISSGLTPNNVVYTVNSGNIEIKISGETAKSYSWNSNWEIIK